MKRMSSHTDGLNGYFNIWIYPDNKLSGFSRKSVSISIYKTWTVWGRADHGRL